MIALVKGISQVREPVVADYYPSYRLSGQLRMPCCQVLQCNATSIISQDQFLGLVVILGSLSHLLVQFQRFEKERYIKLWWYLQFLATIQMLQYMCCILSLMGIGEVFSISGGKAMEFFHWLHSFDWTVELWINFLGFAWLLTFFWSVKFVSVRSLGLHTRDVYGFFRCIFPGLWFPIFMLFYGSENPLMLV